MEPHATTPLTHPYRASPLSGHARPRCTRAIAALGLPACGRCVDGRALWSIIATGVAAFELPLRAVLPRALTSLPTLVLVLGTKTIDLSSLFCCWLLELGYRTALLLLHILCGTVLILIRLHLNCCHYPYVPIVFSLLPPPSWPSPLRTGINR